MRFETPKGVSDIWFEEFDRRKWLYSRIEKVLRSYGFAFMEPSPLEYLETLVAKSGPEIEKEIYSFEDKKGEKLALRFDLTVGMARMIASKQLPLPVRAANIGSVWRYDNPQHGRYRWFWQWDAEIFGSSNPASDAEIIAVTCGIMDSAGLKDYTVAMNSRKLIEV
ncbi:MAG: ATP phosphoribosyltransferase regulatory subunit [Candidatus Aenigmarchaeota archaeon]|nr:ATP phosphoribosyltransferase regulatory subunit [Candidatus Aenigmarchaeota archaeon]